jgi:hypothetical protein
LPVLSAAVVDGIAGNITHACIHEITNGFIRRSMDAFPYWLEEMQPSKRASR